MMNINKEFLITVNIKDLTKVETNLTKEEVIQALVNKDTDIETIKNIIDRNEYHLDFENLLHNKQYLFTIVYDNKRTDIAMYLLNKGYFHKKIFNYVTVGGNLELLKYAYDLGCFLDTTNKQLCLNAIINNHLDVFKFLGDVGCEYDKNKCATLAAICGHLDTLKYLCEISNWTNIYGGTFYSVVNGVLLDKHPEIRRYLNDILVNTTQLIEVCKNNNNIVALRIIEDTKDNGYLTNKDKQGNDAFYYAHQNKMKEVMIALINRL